MAILLSGCASKSTQTTKEVGFWYTFKTGDSLQSIAERFSTSHLLIQQRNDIYDAEDLAPGMKIFIPGVRRITKSITPLKDTGKKSKHTFIWPARGVISSGFGIRHGRKHDGIDITKDKGREIFASASGVISFTGWKKGYGKVIIIDHSQNIQTLYAHNKSIYVSKGQRVKQGQNIAYMGSTGRSSGIHLHFEIQVNGKPRNPLRYLPIR